MKILFVLYHDFTANSASHVAALANKLVELGHECCVAVPSNRETVKSLGQFRFKAVEFSDALAGDFGFAKGGPDVVHAWTPREIVRGISLEICRRWSAKLFVHMEDNEWHIAAASVGVPFDKLKLRELSELDRLIPPHLSHPRRAIDFLRVADGVTVIILRLTELLPPVRAVTEIWPSAAAELFYPRPKSTVQRRSFNIPINTTVLVYTGNVHNANAHEVRSLYLAVAILNREGHPTTLVRAGRDFCPFLGEDDRWARCYSIELGQQPHTQIPNLLALADVLVQPGMPDDFNDFRFPSKLPEFLAAGRPTVLPATNIAKNMTHLEHAYILQRADAVSIAGAVRKIVNDPELYNRLVTGASWFYRTQLSWDASAKKLLAFYEAQFSWN